MNKKSKVALLRAIASGNAPLGCLQTSDSFLIVTNSEHKISKHYNLSKGVLKTISTEQLHAWHTSEEALNADIIIHLPDNNRDNEKRP